MICKEPLADSGHQSPNTLNPMEKDQGEAIYLYCLARSGLPQLGCKSGPDEMPPLFRYTFQALTAVVSVVSLKEFCGPDAEARLQDLSWIGPRACWHEAVVEEAMRYSPIFPVPFGAIFSSSGKLQDFLRCRHDQIVSFLDQVAGREEWAVKGLLDTTRAKQSFFSEILNSTLPDRKTLTPGRRYFEEKRLLKQMEKEWQLRLESIGKELADDLSRHASAFCRRQIFSREASGTDAAMILNWAFLVHRNLLPAFHACFDQNNARYRDLGLHLQLSGPWPPYSFCPKFAVEEENHVGGMAEE
jgi:hypothetical protein